MLHQEILWWCGRIVTAAWVIWLLVWAIASARTKRVAQRESISSRVSYLVPMWLSAILLLLAKRSHVGASLAGAGEPLSWLYLRFVPFYAGVVWMGTPLVVSGVLIAFWARFHLAGNWSGSVTIKQDHELVLTGPYRFVRHPIYTGLLLAVAGTACAIGQVRGLLALGLVFFALWYKRQIEERAMIKTFGDAYYRYRDSVKGLIPYII